MFWLEWVCGCPGWILSSDNKAQDQSDEETILPMLIFSKICWHYSEPFLFYFFTCLFRQFEMFYTYKKWNFYFKQSTFILALNFNFHFNLYLWILNRTIKSVVFNKSFSKLTMGKWTQHFRLHHSKKKILER